MQSKKEKKTPSPFAIALEARKGNIPAESIKGAARLLYRDSSITNETLIEYAGKKAINHSKIDLSNTHRTFKRA